MRDSRVNNGRFRFETIEDSFELDRSENRITGMEGCYFGGAIGTFTALTAIIFNKQKVYHTPKIDLSYFMCCRYVDFNIPSQRIDLNGDWKKVKRLGFVGTSALTSGIVGQVVQNVGKEVNNSCKERQRRRLEARRNQDVENNFLRI